MPFPFAGPVGPSRIVLRVTPGAYEWARGLADHCSLNLTDLVWQALMRQADASGFHDRVPTRFIPKNPSRARTPRPRPVD